MSADDSNYTLYSADEFDVGARKTLPFYENFHEETIKLVGIIKKDAGLWLDTGCGTGTLVEKASSRFPAMRFLCADPSAAMLEIARKKLSGRKNVRILEPASTLDLDGGPIPPDIITAIQCHHYMEGERRRKTVEKCFSMLGHGGLFITFENTRPASKKGIEIGQEYWRMFQREQGKDPASAEQHVRRFDTEYFPITLEEHRRLYESAGFAVVELFWFSCMQSGFFCIK